MQILLHNCSISALSNCTALLNPTLAENALSNRQITRSNFVILGLAWHLEPAEWRFREFLFNLFLKIDQLKFYFRIYVAFALQRAAG